MSRHLLFLVLVALVVVPFATADSFKIVNLDSPGMHNPVGYVYLLPCFSGCFGIPPFVSVEILPQEGGVKLNGLSILFNSSLKLSANNISPIAIGQYVANFTFGGPVTVGGETFTYSISNIHGGTLPNSFTSTGGDIIGFTITGVDTSQLLVANAQGNMWGVQLCASETHSCGQTTSFAFGHVVPEPGTLALAGTGVLALGFLMRRRKQWRAASIRCS
jgi:PEP-CTERM motif